MACKFTVGIGEFIMKIASGCNSIFVDNHCFRIANFVNINKPEISEIENRALKKTAA